MSNLLILYGQREPTNIMAEDFFMSIRRSNNLKVKTALSDDVTEELLLWSDVVMGVRTQNILEADIMALAKKNDRLVIELIDDDFFAMKDFHIRRRLQEKALRKALASADIILGSNKGLLKKMLPYTKGGRCVCYILR